MGVQVYPHCSILASPVALTRDGQLSDNLAKDVEKRYNVSFEKERENREYMKGPSNGVHPMANGGGQGLQTVLREVDCTAPGSAAARVFV